MQSGQQHFLAADCIHLFAHDLLDLQKRALREKQIIVDAGGKLPYITGAQKQLMADNFGFCGSFS